VRVVPRGQEHLAARERDRGLERHLLEGMGPQDGAVVPAETDEPALVGRARHGVVDDDLAHAADVGHGGRRVEGPLRAPRDPARLPGGRVQADHALVVLPAAALHDHRPRLDQRRGPAPLAQHDREVLLEVAVPDHLARGRVQPAQLAGRAEREHASAVQRRRAAGTAIGARDARVETRAPQLAAVRDREGHRVVVLAVGDQGDRAPVGHQHPRQRGRGGTAPGFGQLEVRPAAERPRRGDAAVPRGTEPLRPGRGPLRRTGEKRGHDERRSGQPGLHPPISRATISSTLRRRSRPAAKAGPVLEAAPALKTGTFSFSR
jgi:hypothetical protein